MSKPDLVDKGAESSVLGVIANRAKALKHGYVMLKNRSQEDLDGNMTIDEARRAEQDWFARSKYAGGGNRLGVGALTEALTALLVGLGLLACACGPAEPGAGGVAVDRRRRLP